MDDHDAIAVRVLRRSAEHKLGATPEDLAHWCIDIAMTDGLVSKDLEDDAEVEGLYTDFLHRVEKFSSNDSPCWTCGRMHSEIVWDDGTKEYHHVQCLIEKGLIK
jgi:hypothetical protein